MSKPQITNNTSEANKWDYYREWIRLYDTLTDPMREELKRRVANWSTLPKISVLMPVYNTPSDYLEQAIWSVRNQLYQNWELCIADDASTDPKVQKTLQRHASEDSRVHFFIRKENGNIGAATETALDIASGEYCALLDHDDLLAEDALFLVAEAIVTVPGINMIYTDEDKIDSMNRRMTPYFKPDWNYDLFFSNYYTHHLAVYRTAFFRKGTGYSVFERLKDDEVVHIPKILYHWRIHPESTASGMEAKPDLFSGAVQELNKHLERCGIQGNAEILPNVQGCFRVRYKLPDPGPLISVIIPTRDRKDLLRKCVESILEKTEYKNYEILIIDNGSNDAEAIGYFEELKKNPMIRMLRDDRDFNYARLNNTAAKAARGEILALIHDDTEIISSEWLGEMVSIALQRGVGVVGACLWYPNDTLQHGGVIIGLHGSVGFLHQNLPKGMNGYGGRASLIQNFSAVTGACMVVRKFLYEEVHGLNEDLKVSLSDIDFCLRIKEAGYRNVFTPYAELYHHELSRESAATPERQRQLEKETCYFRDRWRHFIWRDPAYNRNLSDRDNHCALACPPRDLNLGWKTTPRLKIEDGETCSLTNGRQDLFFYSLGRGWAPSGKSRVCSVREEAEINLEFATKGKKRIYLDLQAFFPTPHFVRHIEVIANERSLGKAIFKRSRNRKKCYFKLTENLGQVVRLKIQIENVISPLEAKFSQNSQKLGIALFGFGVETWENKSVVNQLSFASLRLSRLFGFAQRLIKR